MRQNTVPATAEKICRALLGDARKVDCDIIESHIRELLADQATVPDQPARRCNQCNAPRRGITCHKCGSATQEPCVGWEEPELPPVERVRELAREIGYAIGEHGTKERDLDLIAVPWTEQAAKLTYREVMEHIADGLGARILDIEWKALGRRACTIQMDGWFKPIDLSVCPRVDNEWEES